MTWLCRCLNARLCSKNINQTPTCPQDIYHQYSPHESVPIVYATKNTRQYATASDTYPLLNPKNTQFIQSITGSFLYYGRALDNPILPALNDIASEQTQPTQKTMNKAQRLMDYVHTYSNVYIRFHAIDMLL